MEVQQEGRVGERRGPDRRGGGERRIGKGRRIWNRRINEVPVEDDQREAVRRIGFGLHPARYLSARANLAPPLGKAEARLGVPRGAPAATLLPNQDQSFMD